MNENNDNQNPNEKPTEVSDSIINASMVILVAAVVCVSAPLTFVAAGTLAVGAVIKEIEKN